jgi:hypothetical protein
MKRMFLVLLMLLFVSVAESTVLIEIHGFDSYEGLYITSGLIGLVGIASGGTYGTVVGSIILWNAISLYWSAKGR